MKKISQPQVTVYSVRACDTIATSSYRIAPVSDPYYSGGNSYISGYNSKTGWEETDDPD